MSRLFLFYSLFVHFPFILQFYNKFRIERKMNRGRSRIMKRLLQHFSRFVSSAVGSKIVILVWIVAIAILAIATPGSSDVEESTDEGNAHVEEPSKIAQEVM